MPSLAIPAFCPHQPQEKAICQVGHHREAGEPETEGEENVDVSFTQATGSFGMFLVNGFWLSVLETSTVMKYPDTSSTTLT